MATVDRVLPWRRSSPPPSEEVAPLVAAFRTRHPKDPVSTITRAYEIAARAHEHQYRKSGEKYINHPLAVARIVADIGLDDTTVAAALRSRAGDLPPAVYEPIGPYRVPQRCAPGEPRLVNRRRACCRTRFRGNVVAFVKAA